MNFTKKAILVIAVSVLFLNCSKNGSVAPPKTELKLTLTDKVGNKMVSTPVALYNSLDDLFKDENRISTKTSDASGVVLFSDLSAKKYYWFAEKGCLSNMFGATTTTGPISANITNTATVVLDGTGELKFSNTSSNPYRVYINGQAYTDMNGGTTKSVGYAAVGLYTIRVLQLSGYLVTPTDKTYTGNVTCGGILTTTFP